jgi:hypothetical protein
MSEDSDKADPIEKNASQRNIKISEYTLQLIELADVCISLSNFFTRYTDNVSPGYITAPKQPPKPFIV